MAQQKPFASPEAAAEAFIDAVSRGDESGLKAIFGQDFRKLIPPMGTAVRERFLETWAQANRLVAEGEARTVLAVGNDGWIFPVPLINGRSGWYFDTAAGAQEIRARRIGRNELSAMQVVLAYFDAQKEFAQKDRDGDGVLAYARKFESTPGAHDGLYWASGEGEALSPLGPLVAQARAAGAKKGDGYHGYRYKILTAQGKAASGGAADYLLQGRMSGGFALVAWPVKYGETGVMTFIVNHDGVVYEKDLGPASGQAAANMTRFNPDRTWKNADSS